jgi:hypothetical protein
MPASDREILAPLVSRVAELAARPVEVDKMRLWADHQALRRAPKVPVCVYYEGIPEPQWRIILGEPLTRCTSPLAASLELDLRKRIWMAEHVPDDHIVWPHVTVGAVLSRAVDWGVTFSMEGSAHAGTDDLRHGVSSPLSRIPSTPPRSGSLICRSTGRLPSGGARRPSPSPAASWTCTCTTRI